MQNALQSRSFRSAADAFIVTQERKPVNNQISRQASEVRLKLNFNASFYVDGFIAITYDFLIYHCSGTQRRHAMLELKHRKAEAKLQVLYPGQTAYEETIAAAWRLYRA